MSVHGRPPSVVAGAKPARRGRTHKLRFGNGNAKLDSAIFTFSLPAGYSCPFAEECLSKADRHTGRIKDGPYTEFRCYAASSESRLAVVRRYRWNNLKRLLACESKEDMTALILDSLSPYAGYVRVHESGDFFSQTYFDAWLEVARQRPRTLFYAYTKALPYWVARKGDIPTNFLLTASYGGTHDHLIEQHGLRSALVVRNERTRQLAVSLGLEVDDDDSHAMSPGPSFALLLHGTQPPGSEASRFLSYLHSLGEYGHGERADAIRRERRFALHLVM